MTKTQREHSDSRLLTLTIAPDLLGQLDAHRPSGTSRAEWVREAIRQRIARWVIR